MRAAIYGRVSTTNKGQDAENQLTVLRDYCVRQDYELADEYVDEITGSRADRDRFIQMFEDARLRKFDIVLFWALDRFTREGVLETLNYLKQLNAYGVDWRSYTEQYLDSTGIFREAIIAILAALAKQERVRIQERVNAGLVRAKAEGKTLGPPRKIFDREKVRAYYSEVRYLRKTAVEFDLSPETVRRTINGS